jgi:hypothetical protein
MNNDYESKEWADNHLVLSDGIARLFSSVGSGLARLGEYAFSARLAGSKNASHESTSTSDQTSSRSDTE